MRTKWRLWTVGAMAAGLSVLLSGFIVFAAEGKEAPSRETAQLAERGEAIFQERCSACHSIGGGDRATGPDLQGVTERRDRQWILRIIREPGRLVAEEDPRMMELKGKFAMTMPDLGISEEEAEALLAFLSHPAEAAHAAGEPTAPPKPAAAGGDAERGRALYVGQIPLENGGSPCLACHPFAGFGPGGRAAFGTNLTDIYENYGAEGVASVLSDLPFPTMEPIFSDRPLTEEEQADLAAFFASAADRAEAAVGGGVAVPVLIAFAVLLVLAFLFGMKRLRSVRRSLVETTAQQTKGEMR